MTGENPQWTSNLAEPGEPMTAERLRRGIEAIANAPTRIPIYDRRLYERTGMLVAIGWREV